MYGDLLLPLRLSSSFVELVAQLPALQVLNMQQASTFDHPTQLPDSWAGLKQLRTLRMLQVEFSGSLPPSWGAKNALPALHEL